jgi:Collagen triple helix repeat (20 copies)
MSDYKIVVNPPPSYSAKVYNTPTPVGEMGPSGLPGPSGLQGIQGIPGPSGLQGIQGEIGPSGLQGIQGEVGPSGLQGIQGIQGEIGPSGAQGLQGIQGEVGPSGLQGIQGIQGIQGVQGIQGEVGPSGAQGLQGIQGVQGIQGPVGSGIATSGNTGQVLVKSSNNDFETEWSDLSDKAGVNGDTTQDFSVKTLCFGNQSVDNNALDVILTYTDGVLTSDEPLVLGSQITVQGLSGTNTGDQDLSGYFPFSGGTITGQVINSRNGVVSSPTQTFVGTWYSGGSATTTKPHVLIEPSGTTSTAWSTAGTAIGVNSSSGFAGNLIDLKANNTSQFIVSTGGSSIATSLTVPAILRDVSYNYYYIDSGGLRLGSGQKTIRYYSSISCIGTTDIGHGRNQAGVLEINDGTTNGAFRDVYLRSLYVWNGTYSATDYVRAKLSVETTSVSLTAETAGAGEDNIDVNLLPTGTGKVIIRQGGGVAGTDELQVSHNGTLAIIENKDGLIRLKPSGTVNSNTVDITTVAGGVAKISSGGSNRLNVDGVLAAPASGSGWEVDAAGTLGPTSTGFSFRLGNTTTAPSTSGATGTAGMIRFDSDYIYVCVATNTWKRVAISTW